MKDFPGTTKFLNFLEGKRKVFLLETGSFFPLKDSAHVLSSVLDEDTLGRVEDAEIELTNYNALKVWIERREVKLKSRGKVAKDPNAMVYGVQHRESEQATSHPAAAASEGLAKISGQRADVGASRAVHFKGELAFLPIPVLKREGVDGHTSCW